MNKTQYIYSEGIVSIIINLVLFALKLWAGIVSGSVALTADAWHTLSDSVSSVAVILGARLASRKPDKLHSYGHGRWEYITSFLIAIFLGIIAFEFSKEAVINFRDQNSANFGTLAIVVTIVSILGKEALAQYAFFVGRKTGDSTVKADAWHHRSDALSSIVLLIGIFLRDLVWWIDSALGVIIALVILYTAYEIIKEAISKLLGEDLKDDEMQAIKNLIDMECGVELFAHHFHLHNYGRHKELTLHLRLEPTMSIKQGHEIMIVVEEAIKREYGYETTIHIDALE